LRLRGSAPELVAEAASGVKEFEPRLLNKRSASSESASSVSRRKRAGSEVAGDNGGETGALALPCKDGTATDDAPAHEYAKADAGGCDE
jgi:hypothetical protein